MDPRLSKDLIIITGMSGAGRTEAMHTFEDLGYYCIDNLPPQMIIPLVELMNLNTDKKRPLALVCDIRSQEFFGSALADKIALLDEFELDYELLFLEAQDEVLQARYSALRRKHPLMNYPQNANLTLLEVIALERKLLGPLKDHAHHIIDSSKLKPKQLRERLVEQFSELPIEKTISVQVFSFGFKYGNPQDADLVIDVRFLPNPYYVPELKRKTGFNEEVYSYVLEHEETKKFMQAWQQLLDVIMPAYVKEGKQYLSIGIGCTGGQHRSVSIALASAAYLAEKGYEVSSAHRDVHRAQH